MSLIIDDKKQEESTPQACDENGDPVFFDKQPIDIDPKDRFEDELLSGSGYFREALSCN